MLNLFYHNLYFTISGSVYIFLLYFYNEKAKVKAREVEEQALIDQLGFNL